MQIIPYKSFGQIPLGDEEMAVVRLLGQPRRRGLNRLGELELEYENLVVRLLQNIVVEITARPNTVTLNKVTMQRTSLYRYLLANDSASKSAYGFLVSTEFGLAIDDDWENDGWISVFAKGRWNDVLQRG